MHIYSCNLFVSHSESMVSTFTSTLLHLGPDWLPLAAYPDSHVL